jgi:cysteine synthase A
MNVLDAIGNTSMVRLRRIVPASGATVLVKLEAENPTGSMKDRMALSMIDGAEARGALRPGGRVVDYTGGSTGSSLAMVCASRGYRAHFASSDAFSEEKLQTMRAFGAVVEVIPSVNRKVTPELIQAGLARVRELLAEPNTFWTDQFNNTDNRAGYHAMAEEILEALDGRFDEFIQGVGHGPYGGHRLEGMGAGFVPSITRLDLADQIIAVADEDAYRTARRLAVEEGLFAGISSGSNVWAALERARVLGPGRRVVTILCDSGLKYLQGDLFR